MRFSIYIVCRTESETLLDALVAGLAAAKGQLVAARQLTGEQQLPDNNYGASPARRRQWDVGSAKLVENVVASNVGNPRDGYGYDCSWRIESDGVVLAAKDSSYDVVPSSFTIDIDGAPSERLDAVHRAIVTALGAGDGTGDATWRSYPCVPNIEAALSAGDRCWADELAKRARASLDAGHTDDYWDGQLRALLSRHGL